VVDGELEQELAPHGDPEHDAGASTGRAVRGTIRAIMRLQTPLAAVVLTAVGLLTPAAAQDQPAHRFLKNTVQLTPAQIADVDHGQVVTKQLPGADKPEIAAFGAVFVNADKEALLTHLRNITAFRRAPSVLEIGRLSHPPRVEDFAGLTADDADLQALRKCRPGDCDVKVARSAMDRLQRELRWSSPGAKADATALLKQMLTDYAAAYIRGGTSEMATYEDKDKPLDTAAEFRKALSSSPYLVQYVPEFHRYIEDFPRAKLEGIEDLFYWMKDRFGPKPTVALYHATLWKDPRDPTRVVVSFKQFYASHYFQAGLELMALVDAPGRKGFYLLDLFRARVDPPTGMLSGVLLGKIRGGVEQGVAEGLRTAKAKAEGQ